MNRQVEYYEEKLKYEMDSWDLHLALEAKENIIVIDTRSTEAYNTEHIPQAISFPHRTMNEQSTQDLNKETLYICYCDGIGCNGSTKGALNMSKLGFKTKELIGGLDWWKRDGHKTSKNNNQTRISCGC